ncbi:arginase deacetylase [Gymnopus androsaceus JB14]|uniref:histone deacetylase n=1 Tax=Gymnopus androsaceus JB14 TaxID=1447944 RepID=A0A6A4HNF0_9AGAR|nr:arginase deacetylase [Gymnopus androsaceus JB14]
MSSSPASVVIYILSQDLVKYSSRLPSNPGRSLLVHSLAKSLGLLSSDYGAPRRIKVVKPKPATNDELAVYHAQDYLDAVLRKESGSDELNSEIEYLAEFGLEHDCPRFTGLAEYIRLVAGATLTAANALRLEYANIAINWDGGRHHAQKSRASGFCYVADCVLAILLLRKADPALSISTLVDPTSESAVLAASSRQKKARVMYLDLDVHFSDGVSQAFYAPVSSTPSQVLTLSIHHAAPGFFPTSPLAQLPSTSFDPFTLSLPLLEGASNPTYATIWPIVERIKDIFDPNYVVVQCGVDGLAGDSKCKVFNWGLDVEDEGSLGWCVSRIVNNWNCKKLFLGGGGYHSPNAARAWSHLTSIILGNPVHVSTDIPDDPGFPLYAPSFTLDVPVGNMLDMNSKAYLAEVKTIFDMACEMLQERVAPSKTDVVQNDIDISAR